jgi:hypothetical protein
MTEEEMHALLLEAIDQAREKARQKGCDCGAGIRASCSGDGSELRTRVEHKRTCNLKFGRGLPENGIATYLRSPLPEDYLPPGTAVVHNNWREGFTFRAWLQAPTDRLEQCDCGWAPETVTHYRVRQVPELLAAPS